MTWISLKESHINRELKRDSGTRFRALPNSAQGGKGGVFSSHPPYPSSIPHAHLTFAVANVKHSRVYYVCVFSPSGIFRILIIPVAVAG